MRDASLGPLTRIVLLMLAVVGVAVATLLWQYLYGGGRSSMAEAVVVMLPPAMFGVACGYHALLG